MANVKIEPEKRELFHQILDLVLDINESDSKDTAFMYFGGHVDVISVDVCTNGWDSKYDPDVRSNFYIDSNISKYKETVQKLSEVKENMHVL